MDGVNRTLYIPLYGKSYVSKKNIILHDAKAEEIWEREQFALKQKSRSKWLAYFMAMRAKKFDEWLKTNIVNKENTVVLHIGCGMDSRVLRVNSEIKCWYDVDFSEVIAERRKYYKETERYRMTEGNAAKPEWVDTLQEATNAIVLLEGISMYLTSTQLQELLYRIAEKYANVKVLMDVYTTLGAKASKYKNPINDVGVTQVYGIDEPEIVIKDKCIHFVQEHNMTPTALVDELHGFERWFFKIMFAGRVAKSMYRLFEYKSENIVE